MIQETFKRLLVIIVFFGIAIGIPELYGVEFISISFFLGLIAALYLNKTKFP